jgi:hypothetical protein
MSALNSKSDIARRALMYLLIAAVIGAIVVLVLLSTGIVSWKYLIQMHFKLIEICPFCM